MALKHKVAALSEVAEPLRSLYRQEGSSFVLDLEGAEDLNKLSEFRDNNIRLLKEQDKMTERLKAFDGIAPEAITSMREQIAKAQADEEKDLIRKGRWDELVARKTAAAASEFDSKIKATAADMEKKDKTISALQGRLATLLVDSDVQKTITGLGLKPRQGATDDILRRARDVWRVDENGNLTAHDSTKNGPMYSAVKPGEPISMKEYIEKQLAANASHLFESATGGGASGGSRGTGGGGPVRVISGSDPVAMGRHMKEIAAGTVRVQIEGAQD